MQSRQATNRKELLLVRVLAVVFDIIDLMGGFEWFHVLVTMITKILSADMFSSVHSQLKPFIPMCNQKGSVYPQYDKF